MTLLTNFPNIKHLIVNFAQCALNTAKFLLLMRGVSQVISRVKGLNCIFDNNQNIGQDGINTLIKLF